MTEQPTENSTVMLRQTSRADLDGYGLRFRCRHLVVVQTLLVSSAICLVFTLPSSARAQAPSQWVYAGVLLEDGEPYEGTTSMQVDVYDAVEAESPLWSESLPAVEVAGGMFSFRLGTGENPIEPDVLTGETLWIQLTVDGETLEGRLPVSSVPYAQRAAVAARSDNQDGVYVGSTQVIGSDGSWTGSPMGDEQLDLSVDLSELEEALDSVDTLTARLTALESRVLALEEALATAEDVISNQNDTIDALVLDVLELQDRLQHVRREGTNLIIEGANLHLRSGGGSTYHSADLTTWGTPNGLGNLVVGYDEDWKRNLDDDLEPVSGATSGSHNIVVGPGHAYPGFAGLAVGQGNRLGPISTGTYEVLFGNVALGYDNQAGGLCSAIIGGTENTTASELSLIAGGVQNQASGLGAVVVGGTANDAGGLDSVVLGGDQNSADGDGSVIAGGSENRTRSSISGDTVVGATDQTVTGGSHYCAPEASCATDPD